MPRQFNYKGWLITLALLWISLNLITIIWEAKIPGSDIFLFKEAGINLATKGRFIVRNLSNMTIDEDRIFAYYPPMYPFLFGIWTKFVGVGLKQSIVFDAIIRLLRTWLLLLFLLPNLKKEKKNGWILSIALLLLTISLLSGDGDRPDELALVFGLASWYLYFKRAAHGAGGFASGILLGLSAGTSPAAGLFFAFGIMLSSVSQKQFQTLLICGTTSLVSFTLIISTIYFLDPTVASLFFKQLPKSTLPYQLPFFNGTGLSEFVNSIRKPIGHSFRVARPHVFCAAILLVISLLMRLYRTKDKGIFGIFITVGIAFIPFCLLVFTLQPYYLWFSSIVLICALIGSGFTMVKTKRLLVYFGIWLALSPIISREAKGQAHAFLRPQSESASAIREKVLAQLGPNERLLISHDQYFTFRRYLEVSNVDYICPWIDRFDYMYITPFGTHKTRANPTPNPCWSDAGKCFTYFDDFASNKGFRILGLETDYFVRGNGGTLYKNTRCRNALEK